MFDKLSVTPQFRENIDSCINFGGGSAARKMGVKSLLCRNLEMKNSNWDFGKH